MLPYVKKRYKPLAKKREFDREYARFIYVKILSFNGRGQTAQKTVISDEARNLKPSRLALMHKMQYHKQQHVHI